MNHIFTSSVLKVTFLEFVSFNSFYYVMEPWLFLHCVYTVAEGSSNSTTADSVSVAAVEKLKAQLIQKQSDLTAVLQAFEDYKEITK